MQSMDANKAMVVDDSRTMRMILCRTLRELGFATCEAGNGQEALEFLDKEATLPALMLVDWNMPVMTGFEMLKGLRSDGRYGDIVVIMVTTETEIHQMSMALEAGANEYVMKPFTKDTIAEKLRIVNLVQ